MLLRFKKTHDGVVLSCLRDDGSVAVQRTRHGGFFALHDFMHCAVESVLGFESAFLGLMASGWDFGTFGDRDDPRYLAMPSQALTAERLVGILSRLHRDAAWQDPDLLPVLTEDVNRELALSPDNAPLAPPIGCKDVAAIYRLFDDLVARWASVPLGGHLEAPFPAPDPRR